MGGKVLGGWAWLGLAHRERYVEPGKWVPIGLFQVLVCHLGCLLGAMMRVFTPWCA
jgi:hypothetical protein